jgi:FixJ family two-component response regulator
VLLVDDDASLRRALGRALRLAGFDVEMFSTAEALLARGVDERDRCLVLDIDLPAMDGIACKRRLDAIGRMVPTIFITALASADVHESLADVPSVAVLFKPFDKKDLIDAVGQTPR